MLELNKVSHKNNSLVEKYCEFEKMFLNECYLPCLGEAAVYNLLEFCNIKTIKDEIKENKYECYLILNEKNPLGMVQLKQKEEGLYLLKLYVKKEYRNQGFAKKAIEEIKKIAQKRVIISIDIRLLNLKDFLADLFLGLGFSPFGSRARYFGSDIYTYENLYSFDLGVHVEQNSDN